MTAAFVGRPDSEPPIVVDLDGTLLRTDLLLESFFVLLTSCPAAAIATLNALRNGKAAFRSKLTDAAIVEVEASPLNEEVVAFLKAEKAKGRPVYLASALDRRYVELVADHVGLFDGVLGSDCAINLVGAVKAECLCDTFRERHLAAGPYRLRCERVPGSSRSGQGLGPGCASARNAELSVARLRPGSAGPSVVKNILVFGPALAAHRFDDALFASMLAFFSFSLCASSAYILNDLLDLQNDRTHPRSISSAGC
jgi:hypothetical protein